MGRLPVREHGSDFLKGGDGDDTLFGNVGSDFLRGESGDDLLLAGQGADACDGGSGTDDRESCEQQQGFPR